MSGFRPPSKGGSTGGASGGGATAVAGGTSTTPSFRPPSKGGSTGSVGGVTAGVGISRTPLYAISEATSTSGSTVHEDLESMAKMLKISTPAVTNSTTSGSFRPPSNANRTNSTPSIPTQSMSRERAYKAKLLFLLDVTGSMDHVRDAVVDKITVIAGESLKAFPDVALQVGVVGYRDVSDSSRFEVLEFLDVTGPQAAENIERFCTVLERGSGKQFNCHGGGDVPEDVLGGMNHAMTAVDWGLADRSCVRIVIHIGDAPHHGPLFTDRVLGDAHPELQDLPRFYDEILRDYADLKIDYYFATIKTPSGEVLTNKMSGLFKEAYDRCQTRRQEFQVIDMLEFSPDGLFNQVRSALTGSIAAFMGKR